LELLNQNHLALLLSLLVLPKETITKYKAQNNFGMLDKLGKSNETIKSNRCLNWLEDKMTKPRLREICTSTNSKTQLICLFYRGRVDLF
jgi:hypothetical protein